MQGPTESEPNVLSPSYSVLSCPTAYAVTIMARTNAGETGMFRIKPAAQHQCFLYSLKVITYMYQNTHSSAAQISEAKFTFFYFLV